MMTNLCSKLVRRKKTVVRLEIRLLKRRRRSERKKTMRTNLVRTNKRVKANRCRYYNKGKKCRRKRSKANKKKIKVSNSKFQ